MAISSRRVSDTNRVKAANMIDTQFVCDFPSCSKRYSRSDHLARHKLNHESPQKYRCSRAGCGKTFVRVDVYKKHCMQQHGSETGHHQSTGKVTKPEKGIKFIMVDESSMKNDKPLQNDEIEADSNKKPQETDLVPEDDPMSPKDDLKPSEMDFSVEDLVSSNELIKWLFGDIEANSSELWQTNNSLSISPNESLENYPDLEDLEYPLISGGYERAANPLSVPSPFEVAKSEIPSFPFSKDQYTIDLTIMELLEDTLPSIKFQEQFQINRLQHYLICYWRYFHPQFPILNFPSFSTRTAHPLLLLSMLTIGAYISNCSDNKTNPIIFSDSIAVSIRWAIYKSKEFKPPPRLWIVQSLVLLECYEICCSSRDLHERANLHRGLSIQMLKRSPMFGGNPWVKYPNASDQDKPISKYASKEQWEEWIQDESMKRCALATFYLETLHAVVFGHDMIIDLHDVKPTLPCDEEFWRSGQYSSKCLESPMTLLAAIKSILHKKPVKTRGFGRKIILSGLIALSFEVKDREVEFSISEINSIQQLWKRKIDEAFQFWDLNCSKVTTHRNWMDSYSIPLRDLYESYTQMRHYDFMVFAGAPGRMNVNFSARELESVTSRVGEWSSSVRGKRAVVFIYSYFCNLLFNDQTSVDYNSQQDKCFYRKQMISHMLVVLWCFIFHTCGEESSYEHINEQNFEEQNYVEGFNRAPKEEGHFYLQRIQHSFYLLTGHKFTEEKVYEDPEVFAQVLDRVPTKQNVAGLLLLFHKSYGCDSSEIAREHSRLLRNCIERSMGRVGVCCENMFESIST